MPTTETTRQRNDRIRDFAATLPSWYSTATRVEVVRRNVTEARDLSPITVRNILRGRDLNPPPSARNRAGRRAAGQRSSSRALGLERRFGVEFEFFGIERRVVESWIIAEMPGWRVKSDVSVSGRAHGRSWAGLELVSPPLKGEAGMEQVRKALQWLNANGAAVNRSAGTHVHHEARDLGAVGIARVARIYADHQGLLNWLVSESRRGGTQYARPITSEDAAYIERQARNGRVASATGRYKSLNVDSYGRHGTVEVRQHQGTLSFRKVEAWIRLGQGMMDAAADSTRVSETGLRGLLQALRVDEDASAFLLGRALQFGAPTTLVA